MVESARAKSLLLLLVWGTAVAVASSLGVIARLPTPLPQLLIAGLAVSFSIALTRVAFLKEAAATLGVRNILALHLFRFVGIYFLWLYAQGRLPAEFAHRAGWGDIATATAALALLFWPEGPGFRRAVKVWNLFGALDLFVAVGTAGWLTVIRPGSMVEIVGLPLALVPLWAVPVLLASHVYLASRLRTRRAHPTKVIVQAAGARLT